MRLHSLAAISALSCLIAASAHAENEFNLERNVEYVKQGEDSLKCDTRVPHGDGPFPAVLCVHGGAWFTGVKEHMNHVADKLSKNGYTTVSISYRLAPKHKFPAQIEDCRAAVAWMRSHSNQLKLDPARVAGYGYSAGAHLVSLLATADITQGDPNTRLQCVVAGGAPCDFRRLPPKWDLLAYWLGDTREKNPQIYDLASPLKFVSADDPPAFYFHGEKDTLVPSISPEAMVAELKKAGVEASLHMVPKAGHIAAFLDGAAIDAALSFLNSHLSTVAAKK